MNNDITRDMNNCIKVQKKSACTNEKSCDVQNTESANASCNFNDIDMEKSLDCLLGKMQVNSRTGERKYSSIAQSVENFLNNPQDVEDYIDFCDKIIQRGHSLEKAISISDETFKILKNQDTYR